MAAPRPWLLRGGGDGDDPVPCLWIPAVAAGPDYDAGDAARTRIRPQ